MNRPRLILGMITLFLLHYSLLFAQGRDTAAFNSDPRAVALYEKMVHAFRAAKSLSFTSFYTCSADGREMGRCAYRIFLKKPNYLRLEGLSHNGASTGVLLGNRDGFWITWPMGRPQDNNEDSAAWAKSHDKVYMHRAIPANRYSIAHEAHWVARGVIMGVVELSMFHGSPDGLDAEREGVRIVGKEDVAGTPCTMIEVSYLEHQRSKFYWLSDQDFLPRKAHEIVRVAHQLSATEVWTDFKLNREIADDLFAWAPPADWAQWIPASDEDQLLAPGSAAPDFKCKTIDGRMFRLSANRGMPILLSFWRLGCPPCRREAVALERIQRKYADKGLKVVGFNCLDDSARVAAFLRMNAISYTNIFDASNAAVNVYMNVFRAGAIPTNYAIDREGRIVDSWIGSDEERLTGAIKRLGLR